MKKKPYALPFILPVAAFAGTIFVGAFILWLNISAKTEPIAFVDALFIATSSVCVTGLATVDPYTVFNRFGHTTMLVLIQLGGLGITTYSTLIFYIWSKRISITDRLAVGQVLLRDPSFHLGRFLKRVVTVIILLEMCGAALFYLMEPERIGLYHSVFLAVSAFCNAGFALWPDNLISWQQHAGVNLVVMGLIIMGGLGFAVIDECLHLARLHFSRLCHPQSLSQLLNNSRCNPHAPKPTLKLSAHSHIVLTTTLFLVFAGALLIMLPEYFANDHDTSSISQLILPSLFQSVTSRTAGFATTNIAGLTDISLMVIIVLMFIGGSPGSCAGGIKTTSFRVLLGFIKAQLLGRSEVTVRGKAMDGQTINKMFVLLIFSMLTIIVATFCLAYTEGGAQPHGKTPFQILDLLFEVVSAFATVGLSTNVSPQLSTAGKLIDCLLMFIGRLGPIWLITTLQQFQTEPRYKLPVSELPIG